MHLYIDYALLEFKESYSCHPTKSMNQNIVPWPFNIVAQSVYYNWDTGTWHRLIDVYNQTIIFFLLQTTLYILWQISILKNIHIYNFTHCNLFKSRLSATQQLYTHQRCSVHSKSHLHKRVFSPVTSGSSLQTTIHNISPQSHFQIQILLT